MNTSSMHMGENPLLKPRALYSWIKTLLVRVTPKAKCQLKVRAHRLANDHQESRGGIFSSKKSELMSKGIKDIGYHVSPSGPCLCPLLP